MASEDAALALGAVGAWVRAAERTVPAAAARLRSVLSPAADETVRALIAQLDDEKFQVRQRATDLLAKVRPAVEPQLRKALTQPLSAEAKSRIELILRMPTIRAELSATQRRQLARLILALQWTASPAARDLLKSIAATYPDADIQNEAWSAAQR
jgi:hypothetical protein